MAKSEEYVSGEKYREMAVGRVNKSTLPKPILTIIAVVVVLMGLSFYGGVAYQKGKQPKSALTAANGAASTGFGSRAGGRFGGQRPTIGQVTAVSSTSITVQNTNSGTSTTLSITSSTQITDNGQTVTTSDIQTGTTVVLVASTTDKTQAARILANPSFGGGASGASSQSDPSNSSVTN